MEFLLQTVEFGHGDPVKMEGGFECGCQSLGISLMKVVIVSY